MLAEEHPECLHSHLLRFTLTASQRYLTADVSQTNIVSPTIMRNLLLLPLLLIHCVCVVRADSYTALELARHMQYDIKAWTTTLNLPPGKYDLSLYEIIDGKPSDKPFGAISDISASSAGSPSDSVRLVLMISPTNQTDLAARGKQTDPEYKMRYSFFVGDTGIFRFTHSLHLENRVDLPNDIGEGDYLLGGVPASGSFPGYRHPNASDVTEGVILRITKTKKG